VLVEKKLKIPVNGLYAAAQRSVDVIGSCALTAAA
jgi:hypothetical protein